MAGAVICLRIKKRRIAENAAPPLDILVWIGYFGFEMNVVRQRFR